LEIVPEDWRRLTFERLSQNDGNVKSERLLRKRSPVLTSPEHLSAITACDRQDAAASCSILRLRQ